MDFDAAIKAHSDWKLKLKQYLKNPDGSIDVSNLEKDNMCALGTWLHGEGKAKFSHLKEYNDLVSAHRSFHQAAAQIVQKKNKGEDVSEEVALGGNAPFSKHSSDVVGLIMKMKQMS